MTFDLNLKIRNNFLQSIITLFIFEKIEIVFEKLIKNT